MARRFLNRYTLSLLLVAVGILFVFFFGRRALRSYQEIRYIRQQGLDRGVASVEAIRPWMPIRYVAVAYAVPEEYLFAQLDIPYNRRNVNDTLGHLNLEYDFGPPPAPGGQLEIVDRVAEAIESYRENPVATGLDDVRPWMTIRYIANSTGVPESYLLDQLGISADQDHAVLPLDQLADAIHFRGGPRELADAVQAALRSYEEAQ
jgi:hypothetical protein